MELVSEPERRLFLSRLVREVARTELMAVEHAARETRRLGEDAPPARALREVAAHASAQRPRFLSMTEAYGVPGERGGLGAALASLRDLVVDRIVQGERAHRIALADLRNGLDAVRLLREAARADELLGLIRWCDDWMSARRMLVAHAERALAWFSAAPTPTDAGSRTAGAPDEPPIRSDAPTTKGDRPSSHDHR